MYMFFILLFLTVVHFAIHRIPLAALAARTAFTAGFRNNVQDFGVVLTTGNIPGRFALLVPQTPVTTGFQENPRQLPATHRCGYVQSGIAILR